MRRGRERELELLNKYYDVDEEKKIVNIPLKFDKASELIDDKIINKKDYIIDDELLADMTSTLKRLPVGYTVNYEFNINDYENYDRHKIVESFNDALELNNYNLARERRRKLLIATIFLITGIVILFMIFTLKANNFFDQFEKGAVFSEVFDIFGWVFIWEFITILFMTPSEFEVNSRVFRLKVRSISFYDGEDNLIETVDTGITYFDWEDERKIEKIAKMFLLISGAAFIAYGMMGIVSYLFDLSDFNAMLDDLNSIGDSDKAAFVIILIVLNILGILAYAFETLGGIMAIAIFSGRRNKHIMRFSTIFAIVLLFIIILAFVSAFIGDISFSSILNLISTIVISALYFVAYVALRVISKGEKKKKIKKKKD